ncbi:MAG: hypothetical protein LBB48_08535 [Treponema sp.]|nr:hypothetical protein [Treponema sp.]
MFFIRDGKGRAVFYKTQLEKQAGFFFFDSLVCVILPFQERAIATPAQDAVFGPGPGYGTANAVFFSFGISRRMAFLPQCFCFLFGNFVVGNQNTLPVAAGFRV